MWSSEPRTRQCLVLRASKATAIFNSAHVTLAECHTGMVCTPKEAEAAEGLTSRRREGLKAGFGEVEKGGVGGAGGTLGHRLGGGDVGIL